LALYMIWLTSKTFLKNRHYTYSNKIVICPFNKKNEYNLKVDLTGDCHEVYEVSQTFLTINVPVALTELSVALSCAQLA
jgi:hypothetical protein